MDANAFQEEKLSIKNLIFTKAIPNYILPIPTDGRPVFACTDCGDKFIIKSSYEYHIKRKSLKITYFCRYCNITKIFYNRCDLLSHIRSHVFKTATISVTDIKIEPLPLFYYNKHPNEICANTDESSPAVPSSINQDDTEVQNERQIVICFECKKNIFCTGNAYVDRAKHFTQYKNVVYSCSICLLTLTTQCALEAHLRIHTREPPYYCPDCGIFLTKTAIVYPFGHDCESFKMMRATTKLKCSITNCNKIFHPNESIKHLRSHHLKSVFKCPTCSVACYKLENMQKHLNNFHTDKSKKLKHIDFLQCEMCPGRLVIPSQIDKHLKVHERNFVNSVYPCWTCGASFKLAKNLLEHQKLKHSGIGTEKRLSQVSQGTNTVNAQNRTKIWLQRKSDKCMKCHKNISKGFANLLCKCKADSTPKIVCNLCQLTVPQDWNVIKKHYATYHKEHVCLDVKLLLKKICSNKNKATIKSTKKPKKNYHDENIFYKVKNNYISSEVSKELSTILDDDKFICSKCGQSYENKQNLEMHIVVHRDPFMAYQCMECGESFVTKPSFSTHLLLKHGINDVQNYIDKKKCYNEESSYLQKPINKEQIESIKENQCNICREQFSNSVDLKKHYRVHGMAFLFKNTNKPTSPEKI